MKSNSWIQDKMKQKLKPILVELKNHAPFTLFGALTGIICMLIFRNMEHETSRRIFYVFHPSHVLLSAIVTASFPTEERGRALGIMGAVVGAGLLSGPAIGGFLLDLFDWVILHFLVVLMQQTVHGVTCYQFDP